MDLCHESRSSDRPTSRPSVLRGKNFNAGYYTQTVQPNCSYLPIGTIDFYHFILLLLTLTLPGGHKDSAKQNLLASFSRTLFI